MKPTEMLDMWARAVLREDHALATDILAEMDALFLRHYGFRDGILANALYRAADAGKA